MIYLVIQVMTPKLRTSPADTRHRIVEAARHLFWEKGYAATGLAELLARAEANSGSFYHFFESKDDVLRTVLDTYVAMLDPFVLQPAWSSTTDPIARVFALLEGYRQRLVDTDCRYGCPIGRLALEIDPENTPAHELISRNFSGLETGGRGLPQSRRPRRPRRWGSAGAGGHGRRRDAGAREPVD